MVWISNSDDPDDPNGPDSPDLLQSQCVHRRFSYLFADGVVADDRLVLPVWVGRVWNPLC